MSHGPSDAHPPSQPTTAEEWLARLLSPESEAHDSEAFEQWRAADPEHAVAYAEAEHIHRSAAQLAAAPLLRAAAQAARRDTARDRGLRPRLAWLAAAGIAASLLLVFGRLEHTRGTVPVDQHYTSGVGPPRAIHLDDGTQLLLDAQSALTVRLGPQLREVILEQGRAEFTVAHDVQRPFQVRVGNNLIRDIGTTFQVSRQPDGVIVGLLQGRVAVSGDDADHHWTSELRPAQQIHIDHGGAAGTISPLDLAAARGWTHGELAFRQRRLDDLLDEMNRYSTTRLRLGDPSLAALRVSGSFHAGDQDALVKALVRGWQLRVKRTAPNELTLLPAH